MDDEDIEAYRIHGLLPNSNRGSSSDSDSGKSDFDEAYYAMQPEPIYIDLAKVVVIKNCEDNDQIHHDRLDSSRKTDVINLKNSASTRDNSGINTNPRKEVKLISDCPKKQTINRQLGSSLSNDVIKPLPSLSSNGETQVASPRILNSVNKSRQFHDPPLHGTTFSIPSERWSNSIATHQEVRRFQDTARATSLIAAERAKRINFPKEARPHYGAPRDEGTSSIVPKRLDILKESCRYKDSGKTSSMASKNLRDLPTTDDIRKKFWWLPDTSENLHEVQHEVIFSLVILAFCVHFC